MIKKGVRLIPHDVYSGGMRGFVFHFEDDMTPRPFEEDCWKVTLVRGVLNNYRLLEASPAHSYFRLTVRNDNFDDSDDEISADDSDNAVAKLSWSPALPAP